MSILNNISQLRAASTININNTLLVWQPYVDEAEETFIKPLLGSTFYEEVKGKVTTMGVDTGYADLVELIWKASALYSLYLGIDEVAVSISSQGVQVIQNDTHKPAPQYLVLNLKEKWISRAHRYVDLFLKYLEENRNSFPGYTSLENDLFIRNAAEFQQFVDIRESRRTYLALKPVIKSIERKYIRPTLSPEYYNELKAEIDSSSSSGLSDDSQAVMDLIQPALAHLTMARALQEISLDILDWGVFETAANTFDNVQGKQAANKDRIAMMIEANQRDGEAELKELQEYLDTNAADDRYETYFESDRYIGVGEDPKTRCEFENNIDNAMLVA
jgi:hypothetical protein